MTSKYHNKGTVIDGIKFSSQKEGLRYNELKRLKQAGIVRDFEMQPRYELQPGYWKCCGHIWKNPAVIKASKGLCPYCHEKMVKTQSMSYVGDFLVTYPDGHQELEDVKGRFMTDVFLLKQKILEYRYPELTIKLVTHVRGA